MKQQFVPLRNSNIPYFVWRKRSLGFFKNLCCKFEKCASPPPSRAPSIFQAKDVTYLANSILGLPTILSDREVRRMQRMTHRIRGHCRVST